MHSTSETGHAKNVANFSKLITFATGYGELYNPALPAIQLTVLNDLLSKAQSRISEVFTAKNNFDRATGNRMMVFESVEKIITRSINALEASGASKPTMDNAKSLVRKIRPSGKKKTGNEENSNTHSTSQQSYDSLIQHFSDFIQLLNAETLYVPNEEAISITGLILKLNEMTKANDAVNEQNTAYSNARIARDKILYHNPDSITATAQLIKKYVKSVFGADSEEFNQIKSLQIKSKE